MLSAYEHLKRLSGLRTWSSLAPRSVPLTNRLLYIQQTLRAANIPFATETFRAWRHPGAQYANVVASLGHADPGAPALVFAAHHDIANSESENCQDNTASVAHLLRLAIALQDDGSLPFRVHVAFLDAEELVDPLRSGAGQLADRLLSGDLGDVRYVVNLELTANGDRYWYELGRCPDGEISTFLSRMGPIRRVATPYNDSVAFRLKGLESACIGSLDEGNDRQVVARGYCDTWSLCHSVEDSFARSASEADMTAFSDALLKLAHAGLD